MADQPTDPLVSAADNLAKNLQQLRDRQRLTQSRLSELSGIPRPTIALLESGASNPTLSVLLKLSAALSVSLEELIGPPRASARLYRVHELPFRKKNGVEVRGLIPDALPGVVVERMALPVGAKMAGVPHTPGTREYLGCERGVIGLSAAGQKWELREGEVLVFRGDQPHGYQNLGDEPAVGWSAVVLAPG
jgi:transcriptional regulator with XRE-family HTH domain